MRFDVLRVANADRDIRFYSEDPDGNVIELKAPAEEGSGENQPGD